MGSNVHGAIGKKKAEWLWETTGIRGDITIAKIIGSPLFKLRPDIFPDFLTDLERELWAIFLEQEYKK
jgi:hypothetical protein